MKGLAAYQENSVTTQTRGRLIVLLYDGAIKFLRQAILSLEAGRFAEKGQYIAKAQAIIMELNTSLNMEEGGEIASNLRSLYNFMHGHLSEANSNRDAGRIREVISCLSELNEGWKAITA